MEILTGVKRLYIRFNLFTTFSISFSVTGGANMLLGQVFISCWKVCCVLIELFLFKKSLTMFIKIWIKLFCNYFGFCNYFFVVSKLRVKQSPTSFWQGANIASANFKMYFNELSAWQVFVNCIGAFKMIKFLKNWQLLSN